MLLELLIRAWNYSLMFLKICIFLSFGKFLNGSNIPQFLFVCHWDTWLILAGGGSTLGWFTFPTGSILGVFGYGTVFGGLLTKCSIFFCPFATVPEFFNPSSVLLGFEDRCFSVKYFWEVVTWWIYGSFCYKGGFLGLFCSAELLFFALGKSYFRDLSLFITKVFLNFVCLLFFSLMGPALPSLHVRGAMWLLDYQFFKYAVHSFRVVPSYFSFWYSEWLCYTT